MSSTVSRAIRILEVVGEGPCTAQQVAQHFSVHHSTIFRLLQTLQKEGLVVKYPDGTYAIGLKLISIAHQALEDIDLRRVAYEPIRALHAQVGQGHTVHLAQRNENLITYIDKVESREGIRLYSRIGRPVRVNCTGVGKAILAFLPQEQRNALLTDADWTRHTENTLTPEALDAELSIIAQRGWAVDNGEFEDFINCVAVPILSPSHHVLGAISITSLKAISTLDELKKHLPELKETASRIAYSLG